MPVDMRATFNYDGMRKAMRTISLRLLSWNPRPGSGWQLSWQLVRLNSFALTAEILLAAVSAILFYTPAYFLQNLVAYLEVNPGREEKGWGWVYVVGLFVTNATMFLSRFPFNLHNAISLSDIQSLVNFGLLRLLSYNAGCASNLIPLFSPKVSFEKT